MGYSLGQAAKAAGVSKTTVQRAIKSGRLSAMRRDDGSYEIDPAELHRAFAGVTRDGNADGTLERSGTSSDTGVLQAEVDGLREQLALLRDERDDLRRRLDAEAEERRRLTALLTDQRPPKRRKWWPWG